MNYRRVFLLLILLLAGIFVNRTRPVSAGDEWQPISQEELKMTSVPEAPGAPAVYLYRQVDRDDGGNRRISKFRSSRSERAFTVSKRERFDRMGRLQISMEKSSTRPS